MISFTAEKKAARPALREPLKEGDRFVTVVSAAPHAAKSDGRTLLKITLEPEGTGEWIYDYIDPAREGAIERIGHVCRCLGVAVPQPGQPWDEAVLNGRRGLVLLKVEAGSNGYGPQLRVARWHPADSATDGIPF